MKSCLWMLLFALFVVGLSGPGFAATYFVDAGRPNNSGDGLSWATAKQTVQAGITAASATDQVWVKAATYAETIAIKSGVALYGGFAGTETLLTQRNVLTNLTTLNASTLPTPNHVVT